MAMVMVVVVVQMRTTALGVIIVSAVTVVTSVATMVVGLVVLIVVLALGLSIVIIVLRTLVLIVELLLRQALEEVILVWTWLVVEVHRLLHPGCIILLERHLLVHLLMVRRCLLRVEVKVVVRCEYFLLLCVQLDAIESAAPILFTLLELLHDFLLFLNLIALQG